MLWLNCHLGGSQLYRRKITRPLHIEEEDYKTITYRTAEEKYRTVDIDLIYIY